MELAGTRVLVVEDEALVSMMLEDFLDDLGCEVMAAAANLTEGMKKARSLSIDVALLDVNLAGQLSYPIADILRARAIPFVLATGYHQIELPPELQGAKILSKPFSQTQLAEALLVVRKEK